VNQALPPIPFFRRSTRFSLALTEHEQVYLQAVLLVWAAADSAGNGDVAPPCGGHHAVSYQPGLTLIAAGRISLIQEKRNLDPVITRWRKTTSFKPPSCVRKRRYVIAFWWILFVAPNIT
jgi:hypothetical protein